MSETKNLSKSILNHVIINKNNDIHLCEDNMIMLTLFSEKAP